MNNQNEVKIYLSRKKLIGELLFYGVGVLLGIFFIWLAFYSWQNKGWTVDILWSVPGACVIGFILFISRSEIKNVVKKLKHNTPICILNAQGFNPVDNQVIGLVEWEHIRELKIEKAAKGKSYFLSVYFNNAGFEQYKYERYVLDIRMIDLTIEELKTVLSPFSDSLA